MTGIVIADGGTIGSASDNDAISIASSGKATFSAGIANTGTIDAGTFNGAVGSTATFPSGHIVGMKTVEAETAPSVISTGSASYVDSGIAGTYTTVEASSASWLLISFTSSMFNLSSASGIGEVTVCMTSASDTTYDANDDLGNTAGSTYNFYTRTNTDNGYGSINALWWYRASTGSGAEANFPANLNSYSASTAYHFRVWYKNSADAGTFYFIHAGSMFYLDVKEILL